MMGTDLSSEKLAHKLTMPKKSLKMTFKHAWDAAESVMVNDGGTRVLLIWDTTPFQQQHAHLHQPTTNAWMPLISARFADYF